MIAWMISRICTQSPSCHFGVRCKLVLSRSLNLSLKLTRLRECLVNIGLFRPQAFSFALQSVSKRTYPLSLELINYRNYPFVFRSYFLIIVISEIVVSNFVIVLLLFIFFFFLQISPSLI